MVAKPPTVTNGFRTLFGAPGEGYLDRYSVDDAVADGATVPIYYMGRKIEWQIDEALASYRAADVANALRDRRRAPLRPPPRARRGHGALPGIRRGTGRLKEEYDVLVQTFGKGGARIWSRLEPPWCPAARNGSAGSIQLCKPLQVLRKVRRACNPSQQLFVAFSQHAPLHRNPNPCSQLLTLPT